MQKKSYHVAVLGAGIIGKTCALLLSNLGLDVVWIAPIKPETNRVYALSASTQSLFSDLRVWQTFSSTCLQTVSAIEIFTNNTDTCALSFSAYSAALSQLAWIVREQDIEHGLDMALCFSKGIKTVSSKAHMISINTEAVCLVLENGDMLYADCLVGADGSHSWARTQAGISTYEKAYQQIAVVAHFGIEQPHYGVARQWFINGEILALLPLSESQISIVWSASETHAQALLAMDIQTLATYVQKTANIERYTGTLKGLGKTTSFPLYQKLAASPIAQRLVLVGDAAHVIHPLAGQGINLGLRDVAILGKIFSEKEKFRNYGDTRLLARYARARAADVKSMMEVTDGLQQWFAVRSDPLVMLRELGLYMVERTPWIKKFLIKKALG